jgi:hypothetical protein
MAESWISGPPAPTRDESEAAHESLEQDARARWRLAYAQYEDALSEVDTWQEWALWQEQGDEREQAEEEARNARQRAEVARAECNSCAAILGKSWEVV